MSDCFGIDMALTNKNKINRVIGLLVGICLLLFQTTHAEDKQSLCQGTFAKKSIALVGSMKSRLNQSVQHFRAKFFPTIGYFPGPVLDPNDSISIRQALSVSEGDGAAIIDINPFSPEIAEKIRQAIDYSSRGHHYPIRRSLSNLVSYEDNWKAFKTLLLGTQIISSEEIDQFRKEMEEYLHQVKQVILRTDGQSIELLFSFIQIDNVFFVPEHRHTSALFKDVYVTANIAPIGWNTYYWKVMDGERRKVLSHSGHTTILSDLRRINTISERGDPLLHGSPSKRQKRLLIISLFRDKVID